MSRAEIFSLPVTGQNTGLAAIFTLNAYDRGMPKILREDEWRQAGYCLDAPK